MNTINFNGAKVQKSEQVAQADRQTAAPFGLAVVGSLALTL